MKGFCNKYGKPTGLAWLKNLEIFTIIERFNAVLRGFTNYYNGFLHFPSSLNRWIFILRKAAINTIAQKLNISSKKVYTRFAFRSKYGKSISCKVRTKIISRGKLTIYFKRWTLLTYKELLANKVGKERFEKVKNTFNEIEYKKFLPLYSDKGKSIPTVTNENYLDKIIWVNLRTHASFDLPCGLCGSSEEIHMHHIRHIRKTPYYNLPENKPWLKMMALRNRNQIPVCRECHLNKIHRGTYFGANLKTLTPEITQTRLGYDLRVINSENYLNPSKKEYFAKSLEEKGWSVEFSKFLNPKEKN
jgi:hypothetical protein